MEPARFVDWSASEADFNRSVEAILQRMWEGVGGCRAYILDGRGGDEGIDVGVERDGVVFHIYQLKFFPEGMSGGFVKRRDQVKRSFARVAERPGLEYWTLIMPKNPTSSERRYTLALKNGQAIEIDVWGVGRLDQEAARHPDLLGALTRRPVIEAVRDMNMESTALVGPDALAQRLGKLSDLANSRSAYWGMHVESRPGLTTMTPVPKRPDAAEMEPLGVRFDAMFTPKHQELHKRFQQLLTFGGSRGVHLPAEVVSSLEMEGPEWFAKKTSHVSVSLIPEVLAAGRTAVLRTMSAQGYVESELPGTVDALTRGTRGFTLEATFQQLALTLSHGDEVGGNLSVAWQLSGLPASVARTVLLAFRQINAGKTVEIWIDGNRAATLVDLEPEAGQSDLPPDTFEFIDDLAVLSREFGVEFTVPSEFTVLDRIDIRFVRHLIEGKASYSPRYPAFFATLNDPTMDTEGQASLTEPQAVFIRFEDAAIEVLGRLLPLGTLAAYHPSMRARDACAHIAAIEAGQGDGRRVAFDPTDVTPVRLWLPDRWPDSNANLCITPWAIEGISEDLPADALLT